MFAASACRRTLALAGGTVDSARASIRTIPFTAFYTDWPNAKDAAKFRGFDPKATWRTPKVCRPKSKGCTWDGDRKAATVRYTWDPTVGEKKRSIEGVPKADPGITLKSTKCVPVTLGIDAEDTSGAITSGPGGKIARRSATQRPRASRRRSTSTLWRRRRRQGT